MQSQPNPGGERRLGETHCDYCGAPRPPFDDDGYCRECHKMMRVAAMDTAVASLEILGGAVKAALGGNVHVDDLRAHVESWIKEETTGEFKEPTGARWTLDQLHTELKAIHDEDLRGEEGAH